MTAPKPTQSKKDRVREQTRLRQAALKERKRTSSTSSTSLPSASFSHCPPSTSLRSASSSSCPPSAEPEAASSSADAPPSPRTHLKLLKSVRNKRAYAKRVATSVSTPAKAARLDTSPPSERSKRRHVHDAEETIIDAVERLNPEEQRSLCTRPTVSALFGSAQLDPVGAAIASNVLEAAAVCTLLCFLACLSHLILRPLETTAVTTARGKVIHGSVRISMEEIGIAVEQALESY
jgi:hypothetical protein